MKKTKRSLFTSLATLLLCSAMFIGSTFAWFTDTVTNAGNRIQAGTLKIDLLMDKGGEDYVSIANGTGDIFKEADNANETLETLWEPGKTQFVKLAVENKGSLALKYNIIIDVKDEGLVGSLEYAIINAGHGKPTFAPTELSNWEDVKSYPNVITGNVVSGTTKAAENGVLDAIAYDSTKTNERDYFILAVHMKEDAGNEYQGKDAIIDVTVVATQAPAEKDGFGTDIYDEGAPIPVIAPSFPGIEELIEQLLNGDFVPEVIVNKPTEIGELLDEAGEPNVELIVGRKGDDTSTERFDVTIHLESSLTTNNNYDGFSWAALRVGKYATLKMEGNENGSFVNTAAPAIFNMMTGLQPEEARAQLEINGGLYESNGLIITFGTDGDPGCKITINGGVFKFTGASKDNLVDFIHKHPMSGKGFIGTYYSDNNKINTNTVELQVKGGTFYNCDPTGNVATGYKVESRIEGNDMIFSVVPE